MDERRWRRRVAPRVVSVLLCSVCTIGSAAAQIVEDHDVGARGLECVEIAASGNRLIRYVGPNELWRFSGGGWELELQRPLYDGDGVWLGRPAQADIDGDRAAWHVEQNLPDGSLLSGTLEIWERSGGTWTVLPLVPPDGIVEGEGNRSPVVLDGDRAMLGERIFDRVAGTWQQTGRLPFDSTGLDPMSWTLSDGALEGDRAALSVGETATAQTGFVMIFEHDGSAWVETARLEDPTGDLDSVFGHAIEMQGDLLFVGAYRAGVGPYTNRGLVHRYIHDGLTWSHDGVLEPAVAVGNVKFGFSLDLQGDELLVGSVSGEGLVRWSGMTHLFGFVDDEWTELERLVGSSGVAHAWHGASVALGANFAAAQDWDLVSVGSVGQTDTWNRNLPPHVEAGRVMKSGTDLVVQFSDADPGADAYLVHEGELGRFESHLPVDCGQPGRPLGSGWRELSWEPAAGSRYVLLGAMAPGVAGPVGRSSPGDERVWAAPEDCGDR